MVSESRFGSQNRRSLTGRSPSPKESRGAASSGIRAIEFVCRQQTKEKGDTLISLVVLRVDYVYRHYKAM
jgi:hypothetical protein